MSKKSKLDDSEEDEESLPDTLILDDDESFKEDDFSPPRKSSSCERSCKTSSDREETDKEFNLFSSQPNTKSKSHKTSSTLRRARSYSSDKDLFSSQSLPKSTYASTSASSKYKRGTKGTSQTTKDAHTTVVKKEPKISVGGDANGDNDGSGGSTVSSSDSREITAINLSDKSAAMIVLCFADKTNIEAISREEIVQILKKLGAKGSMLATMSKKQVMKALAVKLVNKNVVSLAQNAKLSDIKRSEVNLN